MSSRPNLWLVAIACTAVGVSAGLLLQSGSGQPSAATLSLPPLEAHAMASQSHDNFVIATGYVEDGVEALFFLDFMTGDLKATAIGNRSPGFSAYFQYNISADFDMTGVKNPKYLMVTGLARDLKIASPAGRMGRTALYIVEATSGQVVAYGLPWNPSLYSAGKPQRGTFIPLAKASLRTEFVRDQ